MLARGAILPSALQMRASQTLLSTAAAVLVHALVDTGATAVIAQQPEALYYQVTLEEHPTNAGANVPADFFGLTLDAWGMAGGYVQKHELNSTRLRKWLRALNPVTLRVGGTGTDKEVWPLGPSAAGNIPAASRNVSQNISVETWEAVVQLAEDAQLDLIVGVSGTLREWDQPGQPWSTVNAKAFLQWNIARGAKLAGVEIGNEPGIWSQFKGPPVTAEQHAADWAELQRLLAELYPEKSTRPLAIGPDTCCNTGNQNTLQALLPYNPLWNVTTIHLYGRGPDTSKGTPHAAELLEAARQNNICQRVKEQASWVANSSHASTPLWVGEGGGSFYEWPGGGYLHQFGGALSLLNTLGCSATAGLQKFLKHDIFENMLERAPDDSSWISPRPSFFVAKLWHDLVGAATAISSTVGAAGTNQPLKDVHTWSFRKSQVGDEARAGAGTTAGQIVLLLLDLRNASDSSIAVRIPCKSASSAHLYELSPSGPARCEPPPAGVATQCDKVLNAPKMALNGVELAVSSSGDLPTTTGKAVACVAGQLTLQSKPLSAAIVAF